MRQFAPISHRGGLVLCIFEKDLLGYLYILDILGSLTAPIRIRESNRLGGNYGQFLSILTSKTNLTPGQNISRRERTNFAFATMTWTSCIHTSPNKGGFILFSPHFETRSSLCFVLVCPLKLN